MSTTDSTTTGYQPKVTPQKLNAAIAMELGLQPIALEPGGMIASKMTLNVFKYILMIVGLLTVLFSVALFTMDIKEKETTQNIDGHNVKLDGTTKGALTNWFMLVTNAALLISHWFWPRAIFILFMFIEGVVQQILRAFTSPLYHFELMWIVLLNQAIGGFYLYVIWLDGQARCQDLMTTLCKTQTGTEPLPSVVELGDVTDSMIDELEAKVEARKAAALKQRKSQGLRPHTVMSINRKPLITVDNGPGLMTVANARKRSESRKKRSCSEKSLSSTKKQKRDIQVESSTESDTESSIVSSEMKSKTKRSKSEKSLSSKKKQTPLNESASSSIVSNTEHSESSRKQKMAPAVGSEKEKTNSASRKKQQLQAKEHTAVQITFGRKRGSTPGPAQNGEKSTTEKTDGFGKSLVLSKTQNPAGNPK